MDNGPAMVSRQLLRAVAGLGIRPVHSRPGRPEGRGKIERFFRTVRDQFLIETTTRTVAGLVELNRLFSAWVEIVYHHRIHSETGATPLTRFSAAGPFPLPTPDQLRDAFLGSETRTLTKTATVSLHANTFEVDAVLVGRRVELIFDPFDLTQVEVRYQGRPMGQGIPHVVGRHTHPTPGPTRHPPRTRRAQASTTWASSKPATQPSSTTPASTSPHSLPAPTPARSLASSTCPSPPTTTTTTTTTTDDDRTANL